MDDKIAYDSRVYADIQGLKQLHYNKNTTAVKKEVSQQFESLLMQMVLHSMRDASKAFSSGLFGSNQMEMYQDMFDKQLALMLPKSGLGFAEMVEKNIDNLQPSLGANVENASKPSEMNRVVPQELSIKNVNPLASIKNPPSTTTQQKKFASPEEFIQKLWPAAKLAAGVIGAVPEILLAQAALETNWGKSILSQGQNGSSHNLFNIKAGNNWVNKITTVMSLEQKGEVLVKEKADFRSYDSYEESFKDYAKLLQQHERYSGALSKAHEPAQFIHALQMAGFATDQHYASKIMQIFDSQHFKNMIANMK